MAFQLKKDRSLKANIKRLARRQMDKAEKAIAGTGEPDESVHDIRKCFKRTRALLRLVRTEIGQQAYRRQEKALRNAARPLAPVRDASAVIETFEKLTEHPSKNLQKLRRIILEQQKAIHTRVLNEEHAFDQIRQVIAKELHCIGAWKIRGNSWSMVHKGLKRVYRQARAAWREAEAHPTPELLHEWRKHAKFYWHQLEIIQPLSKLFARWGKKVHDLTRLLGDDHDLFVLFEQAEKLLPSSDKATRTQLQQLIDRRRSELQAQAFEAGIELFAAKPRAFGKEISRILAVTSDE